ncbi:MAG: heme-binding domain-containing protein [Candidatus Marinimicrobia bacterium]|nr:heme-binding domain-containing protein [Candidatus Neomarinimicrobiota bacterium]MBL7010724.1 heme-binding domain-containing protein [Candidatus Neomarinimicrobiota bacterium]MBL7029891.1 heme-binding domain-containing protein [Candidatus Neomarinimicrobiota bacterium]
MNKKIIISILSLFIVIQIIPFGRDHTNPAVVTEPNWNSPETREMFFQTCKDCHSNETEWPWYSNIAPISWLIQHDVNEGREHFNISMWSTQEHNAGDEAAKELKEGEMPPWFYFIPRPNQKLTDDEREIFIAGLIDTFGEKKNLNEKDKD